MFLPHLGRDACVVTSLTPEAPVIEIGQIPPDPNVGQLIPIELHVYDTNCDAITIELSQQFGMGDRYEGDEYVTAQPLGTLGTIGGNLNVSADFPGNYRVVVTANDEDGTSQQTFDVPIRWAPGNNPFEIRGIAIYPFGPEEWNNLSVVPDLIGLSADIGANYVQFIPLWNQSTINSSDIHRCTSDNGCITYSDSQLLEWIQLAKANGLGISLKPHIIAGNWSWDSYGYGGASWQFEPTDLDAWFESYGQMTTHYASISQSAGVEIFFIGNELNRTQEYTERWVNLIDEVRARYTGTLSYSDVALWNNSWNFVTPFSGYLDVLGLPFYFPGSSSNYSPTIEQMQTYIDPQMNGTLKAAIDTHQLTFLVSEIGRPSFDGTNINHDSWTDVPDQQEQVDYFEAAFRMQEQYGSKGLFYFCLMSKDNNSVQPRDWDFRGKPLEDAIDLWFNN